MTTTEFDYSKYRLSFHMFIFVLLYWHFKGSNTAFKQFILKEKNLMRIVIHFSLQFISEKIILLFMFMFWYWHFEGGDTV